MINNAKKVDISCECHALFSLKNKKNNIFQSAVVTGALRINSFFQFHRQCLEPTQNSAGFRLSGFGICRQSTRPHFTNTLANQAFSKENVNQSSKKQSRKLFLTQTG